MQRLHIQTSRYHMRQHPSTIHCVRMRVSLSVCLYLHERLSEVQPLLYQLSVLFKEGAEEQTEVLDEVLFIIFPVRVRHADICV